MDSGPHSSRGVGAVRLLLGGLGFPRNTHLFSGIDDVETLMEIIKQAAKEGAMLVYTIADPSIAETTRQACELWGAACSDILSPGTEAITPSGLHLWAPKIEEYVRRIDGALPQNLTKADIILTGVSRTGKTPLSIYLSPKGYKVANAPIVMNVELPRRVLG